MKLKFKIAILSVITSTVITGCVSDDDMNRPMSCFEITKKIGQLEMQLNESEASATFNAFGAILGSSKKKRHRYEDESALDDIVSDDIRSDLNYYRSRFYRQGCHR